MHLREARARRTSPRITVLAALATIAMLVSSGIATVSGTALSAAAALGQGVRAPSGAVHQGRGAKPPSAPARVANVTVVAAAAPSFTSIYVPPPNLPVLVKAPSVKQAAAFAALNALLATETRFGEAAIAMRVAVDRPKPPPPQGTGYG